MLSASFLSTYQKYKHDTNVVASWLASTAKQHGYKAPLASPSPSGVKKSTGKPPPGRSKGKPRKKAGKKAAQQQRKQKQLHASPSSLDAKSTPDRLQKAKYVLAIRDFVPLAEFIASKLVGTTATTEVENGAEIPSFLSTTLERVIHVRKTFAARFSETDVHLNTQTNATHAHFVSVLEKVQHVLFKAGADGNANTANIMSINEATRDVHDESTKEPKVENFNIFQVLQVYEPAEDLSNESDDMARSIPSSVIDIEYTVEDDESDAECMFVFAALLNDIFKLREEVQNLWSEYRSKKIDLAAAANGANIAIELARSMEDEVAPLLNKHGSARTLIPRYFSAACRVLGRDCSQRERASDDVNFACYDIGVTFLYNCVSFLESIRKATPDSARKISFYNGKFGWYDAQSSNWEKMDNRQRWAQDKAAMLEVVSDIMLLSELKGIPVHDEFARGIDAMFETQEIPIWLCFAAQNYLDTLHFLGPDVSRALAEFHHMNKATAELLDGVEMEGQKADVKNDIDDLRSMLQVSIDGMDIFTITRMIANLDSHLVNTGRPSSFLLHNPLFCGLWIHHLRVPVHQTGVRYAAKPGALLHAVQLYTAVRQQQHERDGSSMTVPEWAFIDKIVELQGLQAFFVGNEPPTSLQAHFKNYCMSRGVSPANWLATVNRRKGKQGSVNMQTSRAGIREFNFKAPVSLSCAAQAQRGVAPGMARRVWNAETVQLILEVNGWPNKPKQEQTNKDGDARTEPRAKAKAAQARQTLTAPQLVCHIAQAIQAEIPDLEPNYFAVHMKAQEFLELVRARADMIGLPDIPYAMTVADIVGLVFATAAAREVARKSERTNEVMKGVALVMWEYMEERMITLPPFEFDIDEYKLDNGEYRIDSDSVLARLQFFTEGIEEALLL
ncbi:hypothetical protein BGZ63DRAFT_403462 [Mariannaea sp. PMI_226]|nr:hypothetical protein BGZ63DRAFT_403462 [Mariannaea sp. PMI_226]